MNNKEKIIKLKEIKEYLSENRTQYGAIHNSIIEKLKNKTMYGNARGQFAMTDGNSLYVLNNNPNEIIENIDFPSCSFESDDIYKLYCNMYTKCEHDRFSTKIESLDEIIDKALNEDLLSKELLDSLNIKTDDYIYKTNMNIFKKDNTLYFTRKQIELFRDLLGTTTTNYHTWDNNILYGKSALGQGFVYTKKKEKQI